VAKLLKVEGGAWVPCEDTYRVIVHVARDPDGTFVAAAAQLPGTAGRGDTLPGALANVTEAAGGTLLSYRAAGKPFPWADEPGLPFGAWRGAVFVCLTLPAP
jgi:predicted RNase H-like HicB family nuclease